MARPLTDADGFVPLEASHERAPSRVRPLTSADGFIPLEGAQTPQPAPGIQPELQVRPMEDVLLAQAMELPDAGDPGLPPLDPAYTPESAAPSYLSNTLRQFAPRAADLAGQLMQRGGRMLQPAPTLPGAPEVPGVLDPLADLLIQGGQEVASIGDNVTNPHGAEVMRAFEEGRIGDALAAVPAAVPPTLVQSLPDLLMLPRTGTALWQQAISQGILGDRQAKGGGDSALDFLSAEAGAALMAALNRFSLDRILAGMGKGVLPGMIRGAAAEAPAEAIQEAVEYLASTVGTDEEVNLRRLAALAATGGVVGGGTGAAIGGTVGAVEDVNEQRRALEDEILSNLLLPDPGPIIVGPEGEAGTRTQREAMEREQEEQGLTPDVVAAMHRRRQREMEQQAEEEALAEILGLPSPEAFAELEQERDPLTVDPQGVAARRSERETLEQERADLGLTPDVERAAQARRAADAQPPEEALLGDVLALPAPQEAQEPLQVDRHGVAATAGQRAALEAERAALGLTPDVARAGQVRREREQASLADELVPAQGMGPDRRQRDETPIVDVRSGQDRRQDLERRRQVAQMTPDEMRRELLTSRKTGIPNDRAYEEAEKLPVQVSMDVDSLKWVNDTVSHQAGDELLRAVGEALAAETEQAFHISGDEFVAQALTDEEADALMERVNQRLAGARLEFTKPDGTVVTLDGIGLSYGKGGTLEEADTGLQAQKGQREARGLRAARGEQPPGATIRPAVARGTDQGAQPAARHDAEGNVAAPETSREVIDPRLRRQEFVDELRAVQRELPERDRSSRLDPTQDDILTAIRKVGGVRRDELIAEGIDPADLRRLPPGFLRRDGRTLDDLRETLAQDGYPADMREFMDAIDSTLRGDPVYSVAHTPLPEDLQGLGQPSLVRRAIDKALAGERLGSQQKAVVVSLLDRLSRQRLLGVAAARERLKAARDRRRIEAESGPAPPLSEDVYDNLAEVFEEDDYLPEMDFQGRAIFDLAQVVEELGGDPDTIIAQAQSNEEAIALLEAELERLASDNATDQVGAAAPGPEQEAGPQAEAPAEADLLGDDTRTRQGLADEQRRRDARRNEGETDLTGTLFGQDRQQTDLLDRPGVDQRRSDDDQQFDLGGVGSASESIRALEDLQREIHDRLTQVGIADEVAGEAVEEILAQLRSGRIVSARGSFSKSRGRRLLRVAMNDPGQQTRTLNHEIIHALRDLGLFTDAEWRTLVRAAKANETLWENVQRRYRKANLSQEKLEEEAVADLHGEWAAGRYEAQGAVQRILQRIADFFRAIREVFTSRGFQSAEDIFRAVDRGEMGRRLRAQRRGRDLDLQVLREQIVGYDERLDVQEPQGDDTAGPPRQLELDWDAHSVASLSPQARRDLADAIRTTWVENVETATVDAGLSHVRSPEDALRAIQEFTTRAQENMLAVVTDSSGKILEIQRHTIGGIDFASVEPGILAGAALEVPGAAHVWLAHNHPSGAPSQSGADLNVTDTMESLFADTGVTLEGMLVGVLEDGEGSFSRPGQGGSHPIQASPTAKSTPTKVTERIITRRDNRDRVINSTKTMRSFVESTLPEDATGVLMMSTRHHPVAFVPLTAEEMGALRQKSPDDDQSPKAQVLRALHGVNARSMAIVADVRNQSETLNTARFLNSIGRASLLDIVFRRPDGTLSSAAEGGGDPGGYTGPYFDLDGAQTHTPAFRRWFGDSKVVDENGDPLVVYHGTQASFDKFSTEFLGDGDGRGDWGEGFYFTDQADAASGYARGEGGNVMPVYLRIQNPATNEVMKSHEVLNALDDDMGFESVRQVLEEMGHDGIAFAHRRGGTEYVVFRPEQIKSAIGNRGTFDPEDPDIRFDLGEDADPDEALRRRADAANRRRVQRKAVRRQPPTPEQVRAQQASPTTGGAAGWDFDRKRWEGMSGTLRRIRAELQDKMLSWRDAQENIAQALGQAIPDAENVYRLETLMHGRVKEGLDALEEQQIVPLVQAIRKANVDVAELEEYLYARHAKERNAQIARINEKMPDGGSGMTNAEADAILARADRAKLEPLARRVDTIIRKTRRRLVSQGLITEEQYEAMQQQYQHYVPLRGKVVEENEFADAHGPAGRGIDTRARPVREALGRGAGNRATNILGEIIGDAQRSIIQAEKARVGRAVLRLVRANPNPRLWEVEPVQTERRLDANGEVYEAVVHDWSDPSIIAVREGGKLYRVQVNHVPLAKALNHVGVEQLGRITRMAGALNRYFSAILTRYNPAFVPVNASRDALFGLTGLAVEHGERVALEAARYYPKAARASWRHALRRPVEGEADRYAKEFAEDGGKTGYVHMPSVEDLQRKIGSGRLGAYDPQGIARVARTVGDLVGAANDAVENALRLSAYVTLRKHGMSREAAAEYAKDMTVNFNRKGFSGSALNAWFLFYNASLQGAKRAGDLMRRKKTWGYLGALAAAQTVSMLFAMGVEDDEGEPIWNKVPDYVKWRNLVFTWLDDDGDQHILTVPMPYGFNFFVWLAGRTSSAMVQEASRPQDTAANVAAEAVNVATQSFSPVPLDDGTLGLVPTALRIPISIQTNRSDLGYRIRNENPYSQFDVPRSAIGRPDTLEIFKLASKGLNRLGGGDDYTPPPMSAFDLAPEDLQYLVEQFTGGAGKFVMDVATLGQIASGEYPVTARDIPITSRFFTTRDDQAAQQSFYYERREAIERAAERVRDTFTNQGRAAALRLLRATPELQGADFQRYRRGNPAEGKAPGDIILYEGRPRLVAKSRNSLFGRYKEAARVVAEQNEAIRNAYASAPVSLLPNPERDRQIRAAAKVRHEAQKAFNATWNQAVAGSGR